MPDEAAPDVIETRDADSPRRRWPWIVAGITVLIAIAGAILVPIVHRHRAVAEVRRIAAVWADRAGVVEALDHAYDDLVVRAVSTDQPALALAGRALSEETAVHLEALADRLRDALLLAPSTRELRSKAVSALEGEAREWGDLAGGSGRFLPIVSDEVAGVASDFTDDLNDVLRRWDVRRPPTPELELHADDELRVKLDQILDNPVPYQLIVGAHREELLDLSENRLARAPPELRGRSASVVTSSGVVLNARGAWEFYDGRDTREVISENEADAVFPATDDAVWILRNRPSGTRAALHPLDGGEQGPWFDVSIGGVVGGLRSGVLVHDLNSGGLGPGNTGDFEPSDELSRLLLIRPDGSQELVAPGCNEVLVAGGSHVLWKPCWGSDRPRVARLTDVDSGRTTVVRSAVGGPRQSVYGMSSRATSPDANWIASTWGRGNAAPFTVGIVDVRHGQVQVLPGPATGRGALAWSPDSRYLFFGTRVGISMWEVGTDSVHQLRYRTPRRAQLHAVLPVL